MVGGDLDYGIWRLSAIRVQQLPGLSPQLIDVGILAHRARGRVRPANGHDELLSRPCLRHSPARPLSALPGRKRDHPDDDKTDVGVDAVLSADVGDAPMRQRQYTAPVEAPSASAPHAVRENTTHDKSPTGDQCRARSRPPRGVTEDPFK